ncbi:copper chaperone PCu(A)C [Agrobacterium vitis]|nr:copper chaperone PCu(A)C [Agrobacterium vitis]
MTVIKQCYYTACGKSKGRVDLLLSLANSLRFQKNCFSSQRRLPPEGSGERKTIMTKTFLASAIVIMLATSGVAAEDMDHAAMAAQGDMAAPAQAITATLGSLKISGGYLKAMIPGQPVGGGFVTINNTGSVEDKLIAISSPRAMRVELHEMVMQGTIMKMRKIPDGFAIAPGATLQMEPGGYHLMFMGVQMPFKADQTVPVTLTFEKAGKLELAMPVVTIRGR